jgi:hypothetical protein
MYTGILYHNPYTNFLNLIFHVFITKDVSSYYYYCISRICPVKFLHVLSLKSSYQEGRVGIQLSIGESWDPVIKRGELGSSYQEGRVGIQLSRGESWDPIIKRGELGSSYQEGRVGILVSRGESWDPVIMRGSWDPVIKRGGLGSH